MCDRSLFGAQLGDGRVVHAGIWNLWVPLQEAWISACSARARIGARRQSRRRISADNAGFERRSFDLLVKWVGWIDYARRNRSSPLASLHLALGQGESIQAGISFAIATSLQGLCYRQKIGGTS